MRAIYAHALHLPRQMLTPSDELAILCFQTLLRRPAGAAPLFIPGKIGAQRGMFLIEAGQFRLQAFPFSTGVGKRLLLCGAGLLFFSHNLLAAFALLRRAAALPFQTFQFKARYG